MLHADHPLVRAIATTVVPEARRLTAPEWSELFRIIDTTLAQRPLRLRRQLKLFVWLLNYLPLIRWGCRFTSLDDERRYRFLHTLERSPVAAVRKGIWGLRTLIFMGYYARPAAAEALGYRSNRLGWTEARVSS